MAQKVNPNPGFPFATAASTLAQWSGSFIQQLLQQFVSYGTRLNLALPNDGTEGFAIGSDAKGDVYYRNASGTLSRLPIGTTGQQLSVNAGLPSWQSASFTGPLSPLQLPGFTFANLPASPTKGMFCYITDSTVNTWGTIIAGSGGFTVFAWYNGTNWTVVGI